MLLVRVQWDVVRVLLVRVQWDVVRVQWEDAWVVGSHRKHAQPNSDRSRQRGGCT